ERPLADSGLAREAALLELLDELLHILGAILLTDEDGVSLLDDDHVLEADDGDEAAVARDDAPLRIEAHEARLVDRAPPPVLPEALPRRAPRAHVRPLEVGLEHLDALRLLEDGVVDRDLLEPRPLRAKSALAAGGDPVERARRGGERAAHLL